MGWGYLRSVAQHHDIWALVDGWEFEEELIAYHKAHPAELKRVHFIFIPNKPRPLLRKLWPPSYYWLYNAWHRRAYKVAKRLHEEIHFDAAWKLSMVTFREPGYLWKLPIPFIWGPVGALGYTDFRLFPLAGLRGGVEYFVRNIINWCHSRFLQRPRKAAIKAASCAALIAATGENQREMKRLWNVDSVIMSEVGIEAVSSLHIKQRDGVRLVWSGQFTHGKALPILLRSLNLIKGKMPAGWSLDVIGDGVLRTRWMSLARKLGLSPFITWHGWVSRKESVHIQEEANVSVITSIRDLTSTVLIESLSCGNPVICLDHCGFSDVIDETCGVKIPVGWPLGVVNGFADAVLSFSEASHREMLSLGGRQRAETFVWRNKTNVLLRLIEGALKHA